MRLPSFEVRSSRNVRWAKCERVPKLMVIAGPNGAGKSTLLYFLRTAYSTNNVLYIGPHRALRRQQVQQRHLYANPILLEYMLTLADTPGLEGVQLTTGNRNAWGYDDSVNYLKHALCQIEVDRQLAIAQLYDREGQIGPKAFPDPWEPLRELTSHLLPHLQFARIDVTDRNQIRCLWQVHDQDTEIDLDDLSSGEKSIIQMFYPIMEHAIRGLLTDLKTTTPSVRPEMCVIIDEPELHLHPNLQYKVLDYFRQLTINSQVQVIVATHSPMIVEAATFDELFLLRPAELTEPNENQLIQVADDEDRLRFLRDVFGTISNVTAMRPLVIVEGISENNARHVTSDRKLYRRLHPGFDKVSIICGGGKSECKRLLGTLNDALSTFSPHLHAVALLDRDTDDSSVTNEHIHLLPVSMIENFLLDPEALWQALQLVEEKTPFRSVRDVEERLELLLDEQENDEIDRRTKAQFGIDYFRPSKLAALSEDLAAFIEMLQQKYTPTALQIAQARAREEVETLRRDNRRRATFHGKNVLHAFYKRYLHNTGMSREIFSSLVAIEVAKSDHTKEFFDEFFDRVQKLNKHNSSSQRLQPVG